MGKYFGTDGFRGEANVTLTADHAYKVGRFLGWYLNKLKREAGDNSPARTPAVRAICSSTRSFPGLRLPARTRICCT